MPGALIPRQQALYLPHGAVREHQVQVLRILLAGLI
jgi:hypothetical protein